MMKLAPRVVHKNDISLFHVHSEKLVPVKGYKRLTMVVTFHKLFGEVNAEHLGFTECVARYRALQELLDYIKTTFSTLPTEQMQIDYISSLPTMRCSTGLLSVQGLSGRLFVECVNEIQTASKMFVGHRFRIVAHHLPKPRVFSPVKSACCTSERTKRKGRLLNSRCV